MTIRPALCATALLMVITPGSHPCLAADAAATDHLKSAIDPYNPGGERSQFLRAAGVDSELDEAEFKTDQSKAGGFARAFDRFPSLLLFDANRNKQIDWFEADAYRRAVRKAILGAFDKDDNQRLTGVEREAANKALAAGNLPRIAGPNRGNIGTPTPRPPAPNRNARDRNSNVPTADERRVEWEQLQSRLAKKYDADGNGRLNTKEEWAAARNDIREYYQRREVERYDSDNDGKVSNEERQAGRERDMQVGLLRKHDRNGDGELTGTEREGYERDMQFVRDKQEHDGEARKQFMSKFDNNNDGELDDREKQAIGPYYEKLRADVNKAALKEFDKDGDGKLNEDERNAGREATMKEARERYDTDGDGELSLKERTNAMRSNPENAEWLYMMYVHFGQGAQN